MKRNSAMIMCVSICVLGSFAVVLAGCTMYNKKKQGTLFEETTDAYSVAVRWGDYEAASRFRHDARTENQPDFHFLKNIRVTSYELRSVTISGDENTVHQVVEIGYYKLDQYIEKTITDRQLWKYDEDEKRWFLHSGLPDFK